MIFSAVSFRREVCQITTPSACPSFASGAFGRRTSGPAGAQQPARERKQQGDQPTGRHGEIRVSIPGRQKVFVSFSRNELPFQKIRAGAFQTVRRKISEQYSVYPPPTDFANKFCMLMSSMGIHRQPGNRWTSPASAGHFPSRCDRSRERSGHPSKSIVISRPASS